MSEIVIQTMHLPDGRKLELFVDDTFQREIDMPVVATPMVRLLPRDPTAPVKSGD